MKLLTVAEFAKLEGVTYQAIYDRIRRGTLKPVYVKVDEMRIAVEEN